MRRKQYFIFVFRMVLIALISVLFIGIPGGSLIARERKVEVKVTPGGGPFENRVVQEAILHAIPWGELGERIPGQDVRFLVEPWEETPILDDARQVPHDQDRAREMLAEAGYPNGFRIRLLFAPEEEPLHGMIEFVIEALGGIGIQVEIIEVPAVEAHHVMAELVAAGKPVLWLGLIHPVFGVVLKTPGEPMFVGSYAKVPVVINPASGLKLEDLDFIVPAGVKGGLVSLSRDDEFDAANPDIMLLAGFEPGTYSLQAVEKSSGKVLAKAEFTVTTLWKNDKEGPSFWCSDHFEHAAAGPAWGGGSTTDPENYKVIPATGTYRAAVLLVDTKTQRFNTSQVKTIKDLWEDEVVDGVTVSGKTVSTAHYYREASYNKFNITAKVFGPVHLNGEWSDYFKTGGQWKVGFFQACVTAGDKLIDYRNFDTVVCVSQSVTSRTPNWYAWPWAYKKTVKVNDCKAGNKCDRTLGFVSMPADWPTQRPGRYIRSTLAHELGHNLGLGDIYAWSGHTPQIRARALGGWALMANENGLPHPVLVHRMKLGWIVPKTKLKLYNFKAISGFVDETITLHPVELGTVPSGRYSGIEVRIAPGWNYYFEYRTAQSKQVGDQNLPTNNRVLGTDVSFDENYYQASRRKPVMKLRNDSDGDGPVLGLNDDYREEDTSEPNFPTDFKAEVTSIDGKKATVRIRYGVLSKPDPSIRPWNTKTYQSPDIEVRNARNLADSKWFNVPWENHMNTLVAKVKNRGNLNAPNVTVKFYVKDFTLNAKGIQPFYIGEETKNINALQTRNFTTTWRPKKAGHYCIIARIPLYQTPGPNSVVEKTEKNNEAQSNYHRFISATSSAPSREMAYVKVHNPFSQPTRTYIQVGENSSPLYRTYIEHTSLLLDPGETRDMKVMFEYADDKNQGDPYLEYYIGKPNNVRVYAMIAEPRGELGQVPVMVGGVGIQVVTGRATRFDEFRLSEENTVVGRIVTVDNGQPVPGGKVIVSAFFESGRGEMIKDVQAVVGAQGKFTATVDTRWRSLEAYYVPLAGYGDSTSSVIYRH